MTAHTLRARPRTSVGSESARLARGTAYARAGAKGTPPGWSSLAMSRSSPAPAALPEPVGRYLTCSHSSASKCRSVWRVAPGLGWMGAGEERGRPELHFTWPRNVLLHDYFWVHPGSGFAQKVRLM